MARADRRGDTLNGPRVLWIFLPAFNEAHSLRILLPKLDAAMQAARLPYRVVVVDDGSADGTGAVLREFAARLPLEVVTHPINRGLGETERDGFEFVAARCAPDDVVVRLESDDTHEPEYMIRLLDKLAEGYDVVNTSRFQPGGGQRGLDLRRAALSRGANLFMAAVFRVPGVRDYSCGYRAYRGSVLRDAIQVFGDRFIQLRGLGFTSTLEVMIKLKLLGCRFAEIPFVLRYDQKRGPSKMLGSITTLGYLLMAVLYYWPFGGWRSQYQGLARAYRRNSQEAVADFGDLKRRFASRIGL